MRPLSILILLLAGCSVKGPQQDPAATSNVKGTLAPRQTVDLTHETVFKEVQLSAPVERVMRELAGAHLALGFETVRFDEKTGEAVFQLTNRLRTINDKPASRYLDCGSGPAGSRTESYRLTVKVTHAVKPSGPNATLLQTAAQAWARNPGMSADPVSCISLGTLETELNGIVAMRIQD